ncbi:MAG: hypothetical protein HOV71_11325 [Hamadaea sp.]|nr:hypothetical protein [Hamadaea sp.]NUR48718.1 hypothetical protein [Hamadaea sp.]NUT03841.1 hypothetical protein [Hamadaea sp.]
MGFGYKTSWLAVRGRTVEEVADALELPRRQTLDWATGVDLAYGEGVFVATPVPGWTIAHSRRGLPLDAYDQGFVEWLSGLSLRLGEVQFFASERVVEYHAWALARAGEVLRAYCYVGEQGEIPLFVGDPTADEIRIGKGVLGPVPDSADWSNDEADVWFSTTPSEDDVMLMAAAWSFDPSTLDDQAVPADGLYSA